MKIVEKIQSSIRYKIAVYSVLFLLVPVCLMIGLLYQSSYTYFYNNEMQTYGTVVRQTGNSVERIFDDVKTASNMMLTDDTILNLMSSVKGTASYSERMEVEHQFFSIQTSILNHYLNCVLIITDRFGNCYSNMSDDVANTGVMNRILSQPGKIVNPSAGTRWHDREYLFPDLTPKTYLVFSRKYFNYTNAASLGDLAICVKEDELLNVMREVNLGENNVCSIVAPDSYVIASTSEELKGTSYDFQHDDSHIVNYCQLSNGWFLVNQIDRNQLYRILNEKMRLLVLTILVIVCSFIAFLVLFSDRIIAPVITLSKAAKKVSGGDLDVQMKVGGKDELHNLAVAFNNMVVNLKQLIRDTADNAEREKNLELQMLYAQINPHFLFNTLNSIRWSADASGAPNVSRLIVALATILHASLIDKNEAIPIREEIENVKSYIYIQKFRYPGRFQIQYELDETLMDALVPKFILQPLIENSIVHGFDGMEQVGRIVILVSRAGNDVAFEVEDNGKGIPKDIRSRLLRAGDKEEGERLNHIGISNVNQRLILKYGRRSALSIESMPQGGTRVRFSIPAQRGDAKNV